MVEREGELLAATGPRDQRAVVMRPLGEEDQAALLAFGAALPEDELRYLEDDFRNSEIITRLINACLAENWRQIVAVVGNAIVGYSAVRRLLGWSNHVADIILLMDAHWREQGDCRDTGSSRLAGRSSSAWASASRASSVCIRATARASTIIC